MSTPVVLRVEMVGGPRDGQTLTFASAVRLPCVLFVMCGRARSVRHEYRLTQRSPGVSVYDHVGVVLPAEAS